MTQVLYVLAVVAGYVVFVLARPQRRCRRCSGWGSKGLRRRRRAACSRCGGSGVRFRLGAPLVHRGKALIIRRVRERMEDGR